MNARRKRANRRRWIERSPEREQERLEALQDPPEQKVAHNQEVRRDARAR